MSPTSEIQHEKEIAAKAASLLVKDGYLVGLGTGSTAELFIRELAEMAAGGLKVKCVASSVRTSELAQSLGLEVLDDPGAVLDMDVDGADEIDIHGNMIKGGGGALLREKIVASNSRKVVIVADHTKLCNDIGAFPLPVEVHPLMAGSTLEKVRKFCSDSKLRDGGNYMTDNGNLVIDCKFGVIENPENLLNQLSRIPGVQAVGIFINLCTTALIGRGNNVEEIDFGKN